MRSATPLLAAAALVGAVMPLGAAHASTTPAPSAEHFVMTFQTFDGTDQPTHVSATGPLRGAGIETQSDVDTPDGEYVVFTWHLQAGDVYLEASEDYSMTFDVRACTAKASGSGSWRITGGTGAYADATGSGTFTDHGSFTGARDNGDCEGPDSNTPPKTSVFTLTGTGVAAD